MVTHQGWVHAFAFGRALRSLSLAGLAASFLPIALIATGHAESAKIKSEEVDTEHMFGFTEGSEIGEKGETELMSESTGRFGRTGGSYKQITNLFEAKYTLTDRFRISAAATLAYYDISGMTGLNDRSQALVQSISFNARYRVLDHQNAPFALTLSVEPRRSFVEDTSGARADGIGAQFAALADRELVADRLFGAFNLSYELERTRLHGGPDISREATFGMGAGLTTLTVHGFFVGVEARYLRQYEGFPPNNFVGQAFYVGPTFYAKLGENALISAAWNSQAWGSASGDSGAHDLVHFDRHQARLRFAVTF